MDKDLEAARERSRALLNAIWDVLVAADEVSEEGRGDFLSVIHLVCDGKSVEYRFCGSLGFGGKVWVNNGTSPYVNCYKEDESPARRATMEQINQSLSVLKCERWGA